jgi:hypothetical protein
MAAAAQSLATVRMASMNISRWSTRLAPMTL